MGICYQGKTLKEIVQDRETLFKESGYAYGLEKLDLVENDPAKFMRFQFRLGSACVERNLTKKQVFRLIIISVLWVIYSALLSVVIC